MDLRFHNAHIALGHRGWLRLFDAAGVRIACESGSLWITQHLDTRDILLRAGESLQVDQPGATLIHAAETARLTLEEGTHETTGATWLHTWRSLKGLSSYWGLKRLAD